MPNIKFTETIVAKLKPTAKDALYWDSSLAGFGVRVSAKTGRKTYIVQRKLKGSRRTRRVPLDNVAVLSLEEARSRARLILNEFSAGLDPKAEVKRRATTDITLNEAFARYMEDRTDISGRVRRSWPQIIKRYFGDWSDKPLKDIGAEAMRERRLKIIATVAKRTTGKRSEGFVGNPGEGAAGLGLRVFTTIRNHVAEDVGLPPLRLNRKQLGISGQKRRERMIRSAEMPAFYRAALELPNSRDRDLILLMMYTGLRFHEAASLRWHDIDLPQRTIRIPAAKTKARRRLDLPMTTQIRDLLVARRAVGIENEFVFQAMRKDASAGHAGEITRAFDAIYRGTGLRLSPHDLRRTYVTLCQSCRVPYLAMKALVNHALGGDVTQGYVIELDLAADAQRVADRIAELCELQAPEGVTRLA